MNAGVLALKCPHYVVACYQRQFLDKATFTKVTFFQLGQENHALEVLVLESGPDLVKKNMLLLDLCFTLAASFTKIRPVLFYVILLTNREPSMM